MRVNVDPRIAVAVGEEVTLHFPVEQCQVLPVGAAA